MAAPDFERLYEDHLDYVWSSLRRLGVAPAHLEDTAHDVFITAWRKLADYDPSRPIKPWLFGIAFRVASDFRERASVRREVQGEELDREDERPGADALIHEQQRRALVRRALEAIPIERRAVFIMHELDGCPIPDVATALEVPLNTAYSRLRLARRDFQAEVQRLQGVPA
ncbi:MAG: sigma-70 family RNA polymerase sigma factor [Archangiaceae bacterium]|nr:sigma-70 family RNA polymerase sigma factor [Archangiaceae bacterium]